MLFEFANTARAADKLDPLVGSHVDNAEDGSEKLVLKHTHIESSDCIIWIRLSLRRQCVPGVAKEHGYGAALARLANAWRHIETLFDGSQKGSRCEPRKAAHHTVVGKDLHLVVRKGNRQHRIEVRLVSERGPSSSARAHLGAGPGGTGRSVMAVRDVERRDP